MIGSGNFHVTNALRAAGVAFTATRHEAGAATATDACTRTTGVPAVLSVHQGCGLTHALTGITEAAKSRTPLLVLAADTGGAAVRSNFRIDQDALVTAVGAVAERVHTPGSTLADTVRAYCTATEQRRTRLVAGGGLPRALSPPDGSGRTYRTVVRRAVRRPGRRSRRGVARLVRPIKVAACCSPRPDRSC